MSINPIFAEKNSPSDEWLLVCDVKYKNNDYVKMGVTLIEVEGAKAIFEIEAHLEGHVWFLVHNGDQVKVGSPVALISDSPFDAAPDVSQYNSTNPSENANHSSEIPTQFTRAALDLMLRLNLDQQLFKSFSLVTENTVKDVHSQSMDIEPFDISSLSADTGVVTLGAGNGIWQISEVCNSNAQRIIGALDDNVKFVKGLLIPVLGNLNQKTLESVMTSIPGARFIISISSNISLRIKLINIINELSLPLETAIHSRAFISSSAEIKPGTLIMDSARVGAKAQVGCHVFISAFVDIEHHCVVGDNTTFGPAVYLSGGVQIGQNCVFGSGVVVEPGVTVGDNCIIASGSIVTTDVPSNTIIKSKSSDVRRPRASHF